MQSVVSVSFRYVSVCLQVCAEQQCEDEVFPLSVNYVDRVLSVLPVRRSQLQLLAAVCMFVASKFKDTQPLSTHCLVVYTDCSITAADLLVRRLSHTVLVLTSGHGTDGDRPHRGGVVVSAAARGGFRHVQHVRPNRGPTKGQILNFFYNMVTSQKYRNND